MTPSQGGGASQAEGQVPGASGSEPGSPAGFHKPEGMGSFPWLIAGWATATAGGLILFLFLAPRRRQAEPVPVEAGPTAMFVPEAAVAAPEAEPMTAASEVLPEEANMPRWLRPSVQAARRGQRVRPAKPQREDS